MLASMNHEAHLPGGYFWGEILGKPFLGKAISQGDPCPLRLRNHPQPRDGFHSPRTSAWWTRAVEASRPALSSPRSPPAARGCPLSAFGRALGVFARSLSPH